VRRTSEWDWRIIGARDMHHAAEFTRWEEAAVTDLPQRSEDLQPLMDGLEFGEEAAQVPPPPGSEVMVVRSLRLSLELDTRLKAAAQARGVPMSTLIREWIELELVALEQDQPISRADALRALTAHRRPS
jgi:predicted DNA-binding protein